VIVRGGLPALAAALLAVAGGAAAQAPAPTVPLEHLPALRGGYFHLPWPEQQRGFHIYVRLPTDYAAQPERRYPIVYLLDGDSLFPILAANHLFLTYDEQLPEAIVVGIAYGGFGAENRRAVDYSPPAPGGAAEAAGAPAFHAFLRERLIPEVERRYRADPARRILFGQSLGGSFVLYSAFADPDLFWGRIASNPVIERFRTLFFGPAPAASRADLGLIVTSGTRDRPPLREGALAWFRAWEGRTGTPWRIRTVTIENGTHAANSSDAYRTGMLLLFRMLDRGED
jgi:uncharacterized protein